MECLLRTMSKTLSHRGPDDAGHWFDLQNGIGFGHRRLSVVDLSPLGHQPMHSQCCSYTIAYNGEVYNHNALRSELKKLGHSFKGESDTEVILAAITQWGLEDAVQRFVGMFAFALWDAQKRTLALVRDRLGIKPLYYSCYQGKMSFASELKAIQTLPGALTSINPDALTLYFRYNYVPAPYSIYSHVKKLLPGTIATFSDNTEQPEINTYWSAEEVWRHGASIPFNGTTEDAVEQLNTLLTDSIKLRMLADVPVGTFLSGGVDSSLVTALMQQHSSDPIKTFTIGFNDQRLDEATHARTVANHLGTEHAEHYLTPQDILDIIPRIAQYWDEPFADPSMVPTYFVSRLAREKVTVALSGDGGDELFLGYSRYNNASHWERITKFPRPLRVLASKINACIPPTFYDHFGRTANKMRNRFDLLGCTDFPLYYRDLISQHSHPEELTTAGAQPPTIYTDTSKKVSSEHLRQMGFWDLTTYLPDGILTKVDRASMATSLESRVPLLDHRIVEFSATLPTSLQTDEYGSKAILRQVLYKHIPRELIDRPKAGFDMPIGDWLRTDLRDWAEALLDEQRLRNEGVLHAKRVRRIWEEHVNGHARHSYVLWGILMFQAWLETAPNSK